MYVKMNKNKSLIEGVFYLISYLPRLSTDSYYPLLE